jgi:hypothetical protein
MRIGAMHWQQVEAYLGYGNDSCKNAPFDHFSAS